MVTRVTGTVSQGQAVVSPHGTADSPTDIDQRERPSAVGIPQADLEGEVAFIYMVGVAHGTVYKADLEIRGALAVIKCSDLDVGLCTPTIIGNSNLGDAVGVWAREYSISVYQAKLYAPPIVNDIQQGEAQAVQS